MADDRSPFAHETPGSSPCRQFGGACPFEPCPGAEDLEACRHLAGLDALRQPTNRPRRPRAWPEIETIGPSRPGAGGRLRVGLWCPCLGLGGAEVWQLALAQAVDPRRIAWMGATVIEGRRSTDSRMAEELGSIMPIDYGWEAARSLASSCDVVVSWAVTNVRALLVGLENPPSIVVACHFPGESPWGPETDELLAGVDRFVGVSELAVDSIPDAIRNKTDVIWNAVDPDRLRVRRDRATMRTAWGIPTDALVAGYFGRLSHEKDPMAMVRLARGLPDPWRVVVVGEGRARVALEREIRLHRLERVHLFGGDPSPGDVLNAFDTLVVPSRFESFGLTLAEGLRIGVPVVSTRSGLAKLVPGLVREVNVDAGVRELADAVLDDARDVEGTKARVERARAFAEARLGLDRFGREWTDLLIRVGSNSMGGRPCSSTNPAA